MISVNRFCAVISLVPTRVAASSSKPSRPASFAGGAGGIIRANTHSAIRQMSIFQAWQVFASDDGKSFQGRETTLTTDDLPPVKGQPEEEQVLIRVSHSSLNYKDALSASGNKGVTRSYPHTPGIDAAGTVMEAAPSGASPDRGAPVIVTGYDLGMNTDGGFGEFVRVPASWVVPMPEKWNAREAMIYGTAGLTAGLMVEKLLVRGLAKPSDGPVLVTGASGAVGCVAVELLTKLGFDVTAMSGKPDRSAHLRELGATQVVGRDALESTKKPMLKPGYAHGIDTVGGSPLAELLKQIRPGGSVACCGLVADMGLETTVLPFILRGVNLLGVDSVEIALGYKMAVWERFASGEWKCDKTIQSARDIGRHELEEYLQDFLKGENHGKIVLDHSLTSLSQSKM